MIKALKVMSVASASTVMLQYSSTVMLQYSSTVMLQYFNILCVLGVYTSIV